MTTTAVNDVYDFFISIHTFLAEGDNKLAVARYTLAVFQSTPSLQKVTFGFKVPIIIDKFQSTPSSRKVTASQKILHTLQCLFQSTPSSRKVTK